MSTPATLPRKPSSAQDTRTPFAAMSDLQDAVRFTPVFQVKTFDLLAGDYPLRMSTTVPGFYGVVVVGCWDRDTGAPVVAGNVAWKRGPNAGDVDVTSIGNLSAGTKYRVTMELRGLR